VLAEDGGEGEDPAGEVAAEETAEGEAVAAE
jgi:hypothetical protein